MTARHGGDAGSLEGALTSERKRLIHRYMVDVTPEPGPEATTPEPRESAQPREVEAAGPFLAESPARAEPPAARRLRAVPAEEPPRSRRGRPPGRKARRQVHFHVDAEQDRLLLSAAGRFGSQQKALIAALHALQEVFALREHVALLQAECERQRSLLAEAEALFKSP